MVFSKELVSFHFLRCQLAESLESAPKCGILLECFSVTLDSLFSTRLELLNLAENVQTGGTVGDILELFIDLSERERTNILISKQCLFCFAEFVELEAC